MRPTPPPRKRRSADTIQRAARRVADAPTVRGKKIVEQPTTGQRLQAKATRAQRPGDRQSRLETMARQVAKAYEKHAKAPNVLGGATGHRLQGGDVQTAERGTNPGIEAAATGFGAARAHHDFSVAITPDGRVVHQYGKDVPADQRRVVLNAAQSKVSKRKLGLG